MIVLETERLQLRRFTLGDAAFVLELLNVPAFIANIGDKQVRSIADAEMYLNNGPIKSYDDHGFGINLVILTATGEPIGMCGLIKRPVLEYVDIGYAFLPAYWSQGYASESARAIKSYAAEIVGLKRLAAVVSPTNSISIRILEKLGMRFETWFRMSPEDDEIRLYLCDLK